MAINVHLACSKRSDSGERCEVKKAMKSRGGLPLPRFYFFALLFTSHRSPLSERLEQANVHQETTKLTEIKLLSFYLVILARDFPAPVTLRFSRHMVAK